MHGYTDASSAANPDRRKSTTDYLFLLSGAPISFGTKTLTLVAQSTVEAELMAIRFGVVNAVAVLAMEYVHAAGVMSPSFLCQVSALI